MLAQPVVNSSGIAMYRGQIRSISDGSLVGSCLYEEPASASGSALTNSARWLGLVNKTGILQSPMLLSTSKKSPFVIQTRTGTTSTTGLNFATLLRTNYMFGYGILPTPVEKTTAFRLRVTVDVYFD